MSGSNTTATLRSLGEDAALEILQAQGQLRLLPDLTLGLMHRLNNVLTSISFTLEGMEMELPPSSAAGELVGSLREYMNDAQQIVRRTSEVNSGLGGDELEYMDLSCALRADQDLYRFILPKAAELKIETTPEQLIVRASASALRSILLPLLGNAGRASETLCRVSINCGAESALDQAAYIFDAAPDSGPVIAIRIVDDGCGFAQSGLESLFQPFAAATPGHVGLGMFTASRAARELGGAIGVRRQPGRGAEVVVLLPRVLG